MKKKWLVTGAVAVIVAAAVYMLFALDNIGVFPWRYYISRAMKVKYPLSFSMGEHGTAEKLEGKTVCVSLLVDLDYDKWFDEDGDEAKVMKCLENLGLATEWLSEQAADYGKTAEFIYDWEQYPQLYYEVGNVSNRFDYFLRENDGYNLLWDYVNNNVPSQELVDSFGADNIIYITYFDMDEYSATLAFAKDCYFDTQFSYDMAFFPLYSKGMEQTATTLAHEIMHLYGAPDWYQAYPDEPTGYCMTKGCVEYMKQNFADDIMLYTFDRETETPFYGKVHGEISEMTAYYVGLTDEAPQAVYDFGIDLSQHDPNRPPYVPDEE